MANTKRKVAIFDIDGTLFRSGLYREVVFELVKMGAIPDETVALVEEKHRAYRHRACGNAFEEFEQTLVDAIDHIATDIPIAAYDEAALRVIDKKADNVYAYTRNLLRRLDDEGYFLLAISGSQTELVEPFAQRYGFDKWIGQVWERGDGCFTGNITKTHTGKDKIAREVIAEYDLTLDDSYGVGDSNGDRGILELVTHPIAFNPTQELYTLATKRGWRIVVERKNIAFEMAPQTQGYKLEQATFL